MELTSKVDCQCRVSIGYEEDGTLTGKVFASAPYAKGRTTTAEVSLDELTPTLRSRAQELLADILKEAQEKLGPRVARSIFKSAEVARAMGEI